MNFAAFAGKKEKNTMPRKTNGKPFEIHPSPMKGKDGRNTAYVPLKR